MADLVVENGNGLANADAYAARQAVLDYWSARADGAFAAAADDNARDAAIRRATQFLDLQWGDRFKGTRKVEGQALEWPREGVDTREGWDVTGVPKQIVSAMAELAKLALAGPLAGSGASAPAPSKSSISSLTAGSVSISYQTGTKTALETDHADKFYLVERILRPLVKGGTINRGIWPMTDKVVSLDKERAKRSPDAHTCGPMKCDRCGHEELASVVPVGVKWCECAKCGCMSSKRAGPVLPADGVLRQSCPSCKSQTFAVLTDSLMCADCGTVVAPTWSKTG